MTNGRLLADIVAACDCLDTLLLALLLLLLLPLLLARETTKTAESAAEKGVEKMTGLHEQKAGLDSDLSEVAY